MGRLNSSELNPTENQAAVGAAKTEVILESVFNIDISCCIGTVVKITLGVLIVQVDGGRHLLMVQRQDCEHTLNTARTTQQVACHGLGRANQGFLGMAAQGCFDGIGLIDITQGGRCAVCIQIAHLVCIDTCIAHGRNHGATWAIHTGCSHVTGISAHAVAAYFCINFGTTRFSVFVLFDDHDAGAFSEHKTISVFVPGT